MKPPKIPPRAEINVGLKAAAAEMFPSSYWQWFYEFPKGYPVPEDIKSALAEWLVTPSMAPAGISEQERIMLTVYHLLAAGCHQQQFPLYLLSNPLCQMLLRTHWPEDCSLFEDARPPFDACTIVIPRNLIADSTGMTLESVSWALIDRPTAFTRPGESTKDFLIGCKLSDSVAYYARWRIKHDGSLQDGAFHKHPESEVDQVTPTTAHHVWPEGSEFLNRVARFIMTLFVFLNIDKGGNSTPPVLLKSVNGKRHGVPKRNFMTPAMIGMDLTPSGFATHGTGAEQGAQLRRGHMKWILFGPGRTERRRDWIKPYLTKQKPIESDASTKTIS